MLPGSRDRLGQTRGLIAQLPSGLPTHPRWDCSGCAMYEPCLRNDLSRPLRHPHAAAERLAEWADEVRRCGRTPCADKLLLLAWEAYDRPARCLASNDNFLRCR